MEIPNKTVKMDNPPDLVHKLLWEDRSLILSIRFFFIKKPLTKLIEIKLSIILRGRAKDKLSIKSKDINFLY